MVKNISSLWIVLITIGITSVAQDNTNFIMKKQTKDFYRIWLRAEEKFKQGINFLLNQSLPAFGELGQGLNLSSECQESLSVYVDDLRQTKSWAVMMLDATAKFPTGFLEAGLSDFGSYDECVQISYNGGRSLEFNGQYCSVNIVPPLPPKPRFYTVIHPLKGLGKMPGRDTGVGYLSTFAHVFYTVPFRWSACLPSTCSVRDVQQMANLITVHMGMKSSVKCEIKEHLTLTSEQIFAICVFSVLLLMIFAGTTLELYNQLYPIDIAATVKGRYRTVMEVLLTFSIITNTRKLLDTSNSTGSLTALHGIRVITMFWIILGHTYLFVNLQMFRNLISLREGSKNFVFQAISNGAVAVDTFFLISGLLTSYVTIKFTYNYKTKFSVPMFLFHRFWRLTPAYVLVICLTFLVPLLGSGPMWHETMDELASPCKEKWWTNLIYLQNFITPAEQCLQHSWFLCVDVQLHILCLLVLIPLIRSKTTLGLTIAGVLTAGSTIITAAITWIKDYPPTELFVHPDPDARMEMKVDLYYKPFPHVGAYFVGLFLGYYLGREPRHPLSKPKKFLGWCLSLACSAIVLFGVYDWNKGNLPSAEISALYASTHRTLWALGMAWVIFSCISGQGGFLNTLLSWKPLIPLSRLTYLAYLVHPHLQWIFVGLSHERIYYSSYSMVYNFIGHLVMTYMVAFICNVTFESPFMSLEKIFFSIPSSEQMDITSKKRG